MSSWILVVAGAMVAAGAVLLLLRRCFLVVQVTGTSMSPALMPGDRVLVRRGARDRLRAGLIVVFQDPQFRAWDSCRPIGRYGLMVKRVAAIYGDAVPEAARCAVGGVAVVPPGMLVVLGDNARSADSRSWGFLPSADVLGVAVRRLSPAGRGAEQQSG